MKKRSVSCNAEPESSPSSILVVDDESKFRSSVQKILQLQGFNVDIAAGGREAKEKLSSSAYSYDLILLDLMMPEVSGHQVLEYIIQQNMDIAPIVVSGTTSVMDATSAMRHGAQDYIRKPYDVDDLLICVQRAIWSLELKRENRIMQTQLRQSEHLHSFLVNNSPDLVFALDGQGRLTFVNDRFRSLLGLERACLIGRPFGELVFAEDRHQFEAFLNTVLQRPSEMHILETRLVRSPAMVSPGRDVSTLLPCDIRVIVTEETALNPGREANAVGIYGAARDQTERKRSEEHIRRLAYYDSLTGLPNRQLFKDRLQQALERAHRSGRFLALLFIDLDKFKYINDTLGHHAGDTLLKEVSQRLVALVRKQDSVARISGDEFVVILEQIRGANDVGVVAQKILASLEAPYNIEQNTLHISASIGISMFPQDGLGEEVLIKHADVAMYRAKEKGRGNFQFFTAEMTDWMIARVEMKARLMSALRDGQLTLYFQPQFELESGRLVGAEALVRWLDPERGLILPERFLPIAEENGLILPVGEWVLNEACRRVKGWQDLGLPLQRVSVNLSAKQILGADMVQTVERILRETGLSSDSLELEITESFFLEQKQGLLQKLKTLRRLGVSLSVDDFGTGYSSLSILKHLPIDRLKIDRSFIRDVPQDKSGRAIIRAILAMGESLELGITAEGVETEAQDDFLRGEGCGEVQGFLYHPPLSEPEMMDLLSRLNPASGMEH